MVVDAPTTEDGDRAYLVVAITTNLPDPPTADHVALPWHRDRHPRTGLDERNAALCSWVVLVGGSRIVRRIGDTPAARLLEIAAALARLRAERDP